MLVKTTFKSHFKFKNIFVKKRSKKIIFVKNVLILILFSKVFLKICEITINFKKRRFKKLSILKAPSRHKKFFHQICYEHFFVKMGFLFKANAIIGNSCSDAVKFFRKIDHIFGEFGSNTLTRTVFKLRFKIGINLYLL